MGIQKLWYVKKGESTSGPFPAKVIMEHRLIGRIHPDDLVSLDQLNWQPLAEVPELAPSEQLDSSGMDYEQAKWIEERHKAAQRWADERSTLDRRENTDGVSLDERRKKGDRRMHPESVETLLLRQRHGELKFKRGEDTRSKVIFIAAASLLLLIVAGYWLFKPVNPFQVDMGKQSVSCNQPGHSQINWSGCDKNGAWLENIDLSNSNLTGTRLNSAVLNGANLKYATLLDSDLSYASLRFAKLSGANLNNANLSYADLQGADLSYADMRNANLLGSKLDDAILDNAIWSDGRTCATGSKGQCK